jgi:hypothetical protein
MIMKRILFVTVFLMMTGQIMAQGFEGFYEHSTDIHLIKSSPGYTSFGFQFASGNVGRWKMSIEYTTLAVPDIAITATLNTLTGKHPDKSPFTNLWGSLAVGVNIISTDKIIVSAGGNITDYQMNDDVDESAFYTAGTYARFDYLINDKFMLRVRNYLSKSFKNGSTITDMSNPQEGLSPLFIRTGAEVMYTNRFVAGIELINATNYPGVSANRFNLRFGYRLG